MENALVAGGADSGFANLKGNRSQTGYILGMADPEIEHTRGGKLATFVPVEHRSNKIKRVVRNALSAEAYGYSDAVAAAKWIRSFVDEWLGLPVRRLREDDGSQENRSVIIATDAKSLYDALVTDKSSTTSGEKRIALELNLSKQEMAEEDVKVKWAPTTHVIADPLVKIKSVGDASRKYMRTVLDSLKWTFGRDDRAPSDNRQRGHAKRWYAAGGDPAVLEEENRENADDEDQNVEIGDLVNQIYGVSASSKEWVDRLETERRQEESDWAAPLKMALHTALLAMRSRRFKSAGPPSG